VISHIRPCFFRWLKQFNHSHPPSTNFNQLQSLLSTTKFHCNHSQPTLTYFNQLHLFTTPYLPLKETDPKSIHKYQSNQQFILLKIFFWICLFEHLEILGNCLLILPTCYHLLLYTIDDHSLRLDFHCLL